MYSEYSYLNFPLLQPFSYEFQKPRSQDKENKQPPLTLSGSVHIKLKDVAPKQINPKVEVRSGLVPIGEDFSGVRTNRINYLA